MTNLEAVTLALYVLGLWYFIILRCFNLVGGGRLITYCVTVDLYTIFIVLIIYLSVCSPHTAIMVIVFFDNSRQIVFNQDSYQK